MITDQEKQLIINEVIEAIYLKLPEIIGNLMTNHVNMVRLNRDFYAKHKEFLNNKSTVASVIEMIQGQDPTRSYEEILKKAVPEINKQLGIMKELDFEPGTSDRQLKHGEI